MNKKLSFLYHIGEAITPLDGRNKHKIRELSYFFSEKALDKFRLLIELSYLKKLSQYKVIRSLTNRELTTIFRKIKAFSLKDYEKIREIEKKTNHDLKAVEEFIRDSLKKTSLKDVVEMIHFSLTSDDINNLAYVLMIKGSLKKIIIPELEKIEENLKEKSRKYKNIPMLARTHGQPAAPTTVGKEFLVYRQRLKEEIKILKNLLFKGKLTGNSGNLNAHKFVFPKINWLKFSEEFIASLGLEQDLVTTQIEPYDSLIRIFNSLLCINNILLGLSIDFWYYISLGYFKQKLIKTEVGSTALPHKINPIYFEGAEGGFGIANSLLEFYCRKLSYSRLQRDLSDSTVRRSFGIAFGYCLLSYQSINEGLNRIEADYDNIKYDLTRHPEVISEAIQNFLRTKDYKDAYDKTKKFFRGKDVDLTSIKKFIKNFKLEEGDEEKLIGLLPEKYTGYAEEIVNKFLNIKQLKVKKLLKIKRLNTNNSFNI